MVSALSVYTPILSADTELYEAVANYVGVPADVLYAIAVAESGLYQKGRVSPWPWTLNVEGEAQRFDNRQAMFDGLMVALKAGRSRVDIGLMQVNWHWQFDKVSSPWTITDPTANLKTGALILKGHYEDTGDWWEAVGRYHRPSQAPEHRAAALKYAGRVKEAFDRHVTQGVADG